MTVDHVLGVLAVALGVALVVGHRPIARQVYEGQLENLRRPMAGAMWEASQRQTPRWMRGERLLLHVARATLLVAGAACAYVGVQLLAAAA